ncbi:MAG: hypothetical protein H8D70_00740 [Rhodospirillaceae bacterium]|nr:hypothetical protein [Rhodospirillaceae bacterium]
MSDKPQGRKPRSSLAGRFCGYGDSGVGGCVWVGTLERDALAWSTIADGFIGQTRVLDLPPAVSWLGRGS